MSQSKKTPSELNFEQALARMEEICRILETGKSGLEESLALYEEGVKLAALCRGRLEDAEKRIGEVKPDDNGL